MNSPALTTAARAGRLFATLDRTGAREDQDAIEVLLAETADAGLPYASDMFRRVLADDLDLLRLRLLGAGSDVEEAAHFLDANLPGLRRSGLLDVARVAAAVDACDWDEWLKPLMELTASLTVAAKEVARVG